MVRAILRFLQMHFLFFNQAFSEAAKQTADSFQKDEAPFVVKNMLGLPVSLQLSTMFHVVGKQTTNNAVTLQSDETLRMNYSSRPDSDQFLAMISLSEKDYYIQPSKLHLQLGCTQSSTVIFSF